MKVYTGESIRNIEKACFESGITELRLMENAGVACAKVIRQTYSLEQKTGKSVAILCGKGKNGGDGFVIARKLYEIGAVPTVILTHAFPSIKEPVQMFERAKELGIRYLHYDEDRALCLNAISSADIIVDCIFGIGYRGNADDKTREIFKAVNNSSAETVSIDVPSGLDSEGINFDPYHIKADLTVSISALKPVHIAAATSKDCGRVETVNINIDKKYFSLEKPVAEVTDGDTVKEFMPKRPADANKGTFGHLLMLCGSYRMAGAAVMSAKAAERSGVGKITLAFPEKAYPAVASKLNEPLFLPLAYDEKGFFDVSARDEVIKELENKSAVLVGCGIGKDIGSRAVVETVFKRCKAPILVDADGINILSENIYLLDEREEMTVLTPHLGEFSKLIDKPISDILLNRKKYAEQFAELHPNTVLVLKGKNTLIACKGEILYINSTGNAGLAQGGTGDALAGLMAGFIAQGISPLKSAVMAAHIHGEAGDMCAKELSQRGMTTDDVINFLPSSIKKYCRD